MYNTHTDAHTLRRTLHAREDLGDLEGLRHELLQLARARDSDLITLGQLVHAQNGNDILVVW
jgi:hypothetical protein